MNEIIHQCLTIPLSLQWYQILKNRLIILEITKVIVNPLQKFVDRLGKNSDKTGKITTTQKN